MTAKEYLEQLKRLQRSVAMRMQQLDELDSLIAGLRSPIIQNGKVQTSAGNGGLEENIIKFNDCRDKLTKDIARYLTKKQQIIKEIESMPEEKGNDKNYKEVLIHKYVEFKKLDEIAELMGYEYTWVCKLHGRALKEFEKLYLQKRSY